MAMARPVRVSAIGGVRIRPPHAPKTRARKTWACEQCLLVAPDGVYPSQCEHGDAAYIFFPSKLEAEVYVRLRQGLKPDEKLLRQVRFPLLGIAPKAGGKVHTITIDFVLLTGEFTPDGRRKFRAIDAKGRRFPDWELRKAAFQSTYGVEIEEVYK